jgi:D-alanyl-D-alanine carboxypeptidase (penicillin-binding protein 5/6)
MIFKRNILYFLILAIVHSSLFAVNPTKKAEEAQGFGDIYAKGALLVDVSTGTVLFEKNKNETFKPASIVKLMTGLLVYEKTQLQGSVLIEPEDTYVEPSHVPLRAGEWVTVDDLVHSLLIGSDNDSAMALARHVGGSTPKFVAMMNAKAKQIGCLNTYFSNPHGLPDNQTITSAYDMMLIFNEFMKVPKLREITKLKNYEIRTRVGRQNIKNHNKLLGKLEGMGSAKTGWTYASKHTYAASVIRNNRELRLILLNSSNKWSDAEKLFNYEFNHLPVIKNMPHGAPEGQLVQSESPLPTPTQVTLASNSAEIPVPIISHQPQAPKKDSEKEKKNLNEKKEDLSKKENLKPIEKTSKKEEKPTPKDEKVKPEKPKENSKTEGAQAKSKKKIKPLEIGKIKLSPYTVKKGDTLDLIAKKHKCTVEEVMLHNPIINPNKISPGVILYLPTPAGEGKKK